MTKRILSGALWFYTGWYAGAMIAFHLGISEGLGPVVGAAAAALFAGDPRGLIWKREARSGVRSTTTPSLAR
jgi:hypothetical protein